MTSIDQFSMVDSTVESFFQKKNLSKKNTKLTVLIET